jgi:hypothetical protein
MQRKFEIVKIGGTWLGEDEIVQYHSINKAQYRALHIRWGKTICSDCGIISHEAGDENCWGPQIITVQQLEKIKSESDYFKEMNYV